ncbi:MAG: hypothetical protein IJO00_01980 [Clostridia bacterium]|nr:hypothetical protein [Clostridia bacterium]
MTRGSTPTFSFILPAHTSLFNEIEIFFVQNDSTVLTVTKNELDLKDYEVSFFMTEENSLKFEASVPAEIQIRLVTNDGVILVSEIRRIAIRKKYPVDA